jgi:hypothetical protein
MGSASSCRRLRAVGPLPVGLVALLLAACGHGHYHDHHASGSVSVSPPPLGTLEVYNVPTSRDAIGAIETDRDPGASVRHVVFVPQDDSAFFDVLPGSYDVTVFWDGGGSDTFFNLDVFSTRTTTLSVRF